MVRFTVFALTKFRDLRFRFVSDVCQKAGFSSLLLVHCFHGPIEETQIEPFLPPQGMQALKGGMLDDHIPKTVVHHMS